MKQIIKRNTSTRKVYEVFLNDIHIINQLIEMVKEAKKDSEKGVRDCEGRDSDIYQGWVEALDFVQTSIDGLLLDETENDPLKVSEETQSALNKIADSYLRANYPKSLNGLFSFAKVIDLETEVVERISYGRTDTFDIYHVRISYGRQDDCYNDRYQKVVKVRTDNLEEVIS